MKQVALLTAFAIVLVQLPSGRVQAEPEAILHMDGENAAVDLVSVGPPESTEIYTWRGVISVRLYGVDTGDRDVLGDGDAVEKIMLRRSRRGFSVLRIQLTDHRLRVDKNAVRLEVAPTNFRVLVPRNLLPNPPMTLSNSAGDATPDITAGRSATHAAKEQVVAKAPVGAATAATDHPGEGHAANTGEQYAAPSAVRRSATSLAEHDSPEASQAAGAAKSKAAKTKPRMKAEAPHVSSYVWVLLLLSVCLGLMYGLIKLIAAKSRGFVASAPINVVSAKRLGPRHQLVIVRALGEDHLLSVQGGQTLLISSAATSPIPDGSGGGMIDEPTVDIQLPTKLPFSSAVAGILRLRGTQTE